MVDSEEKKYYNANIKLSYLGSNTVLKRPCNENIYDMRKYVFRKSILQKSNTMSTRTG